MKWFCLLLSVFPLFGGSATLTFTKSFPGSVPAYVSVTVDHAGDLRYREAVDDEAPVKAHLSESEVAELWNLTEQLKFFKEPIESGLKVANTGKKTFRFVDESGTATEAVFNYSQLVPAQQLLDRFEQIAASERAYSDLSRTARFDKLGVNDSLAQIESLWLRKQLAAPGQFLPLLERVATHESYMHLARERAARLKDAFTAPSQAPQAPSPETTPTAK
jgi:hypothetical protein